MSTTNTQAEARGDSARVTEGADVAAVVRERNGEAARRVRDAGTAASCRGPVSSCCGGASIDGSVDPITSRLHVHGDTDELPSAVVPASLACGNPTAPARLHPGEVGRDRGSRGSIDVLLSARRVGPTGMAHGLDLTDDTLAPARCDAEEAGVTNAEFLRGRTTTHPPSVTHMTTPTLRTAVPADLPAVERLLAAVDLPTAGVADLFATRADDFVVADDPTAPGEFAAVAGLEVCCDNALLRSVAVRPEWRARGLGQALVKRVVCRAEERGIDALYLLTMTAEHYFPRFGFERLDRGAVPAEIAATLEFRRACPASAVAMTKSIARPPERRAEAVA